MKKLVFLLELSAVWLKKLGEKLRPFIIPIMFFLLVFSLLTHQNIKNELELPADGWSRSLPIKTDKFGEVKPFIYKENGKHHVYVPENSEIFVFTLDNNLQVENQQSIPVSIPYTQNFWTNGKEVIFVRDKSLIHFDGKNENVLDHDVYGLDANKNKIIYFKEREILSVETDSMAINSIDLVEERLKSVSLNETSKSFISVGVVTEQTKMIKSFFYKYKEGSNYTKHQILNKDEGLSENHFGFYFIENGSDLTVYYTLFRNSSGAKSYYIFQGKNNLKSDDKWDFIKMTFQDKNGLEIENPKFVEYRSLKNNEAALLFTTRGMKSIDKEAVNVYEAQREGDIWLTERRSTTSHSAMYPHWVSKESIIWMNMVGLKEYTFSGASTNSDFVKESLIKTKEDVKQAVSATTISLFQGLIVTISALYWITPAILFCLIIYIVKISLMENEDKRIKYTILTIYLGVQIIFIQKLFNDHYYYFAPDFLAFYGSSLIIPLVIALLSGASLIIGKKQEWSMMLSISYFIIVNILFLSLTVGPFTF
jgi:hypothetical protein